MAYTEVSGGLNADGAVPPLELPAGEVVGASVLLVRGDVGFVRTSRPI